MVAAPPKDKKLTKDTPVSPTDAMTHVHGVVTGIQGTLAQGLGDKNNPDAFAMSQMRTIRNNGTTIAAASSKQKDITAQKAPKIEKSKMVGEAIARKAVELGVKKVVFDRSGYIYHGRVKAVAEGAREAGLEF